LVIRLFAWRLAFVSDGKCNKSAVMKGSLTAHCLPPVASTKPLLPDQRKRAELRHDIWLRPGEQYAEPSLGLFVCRVLWEKWYQDISR